MGGRWKHLVGPPTTLHPRKNPPDRGVDPWKIFFRLERCNANFGIQAHWSVAPYLGINDEAGEGAVPKSNAFSRFVLRKIILTTAFCNVSFYNYLCSISGIYVDPSYRLGLPPQLKEVGKKSFLEVARRVQELKNSSIVIEISESSQDLFANDQLSHVHSPAFDCSSTPSNSFESSLDEQQNRLLAASGERAIVGLSSAVARMEEFP